MAEVKTISEDGFDAVLMIAFGGPEKPEDVRPFLAKVSQGRVPVERLEAVAHHYDLFGGKSPVKQVTSRQADALKATLGDQGMPFVVYVGMRNWHPLLVDTVRQMSRDGVKRAVGLIMSVYQSRSSWAQYQTDVKNVIAEAGADLYVTYTSPLFDHPKFIEAVSNRVKECLEQVSLPDRESAHILFTAHSLPHTDPQVELYARQVDRSVTLVAERLDHVNWQLAYQSRSGRPQDPWLEPDVNDVLRRLGSQGVRHVVAVPIGFVCDNIEVLYDLDIEAMETARQVGITLLRARTVDHDQAFIDALADVVKKVVM
ncbi:MAG: ferrochelatase [Desulfobacterales bacterium]|nr:ferrochelatase [Desulfobacterales bacterium]